MRQCTNCAAAMVEGFVIEGGFAYYCSDSCLTKHITKEEWTALYNDGNSDSYWTTWEEEEKQD